MKKHLAFLAVLGAFAGVASAADYYVVAPLSGKTVNTNAIQVSLAPAALPGAMVGSIYPTLTTKGSQSNAAQFSQADALVVLVR